MTKPVVALVGRPNVGKSTLFNRLSGEPRAIVDDVPGTTRDRLFGESSWNGIPFDIIDTGGIDPSSSRKDPLSIGSADYITQIRWQAEMAVRESDVILFVVDASSGVTPADEEVAQMLRRHQKMVDGKLTPPVLLVVNTADSAGLRSNAVDFHALGMGEPYALSALHGTGTGDLLDELVALFPPKRKRWKTTPSRWLLSASPM
jgi:GTP-binding protein